MCVLITEPRVCLCVWFQTEDIHLSIDKIDESVTEIKKLYSTILSAPTSDQSNILLHNYTLHYTHVSHIFCCS